MQPAAQVFHLGVDEIEIVGLVDVVAPHGFGQRRLVDHMVRAAHEIIEYIVLLAQQFDLPARDFHPAAVGKQPHVSGIETLLTAALVTAHDAPDPGAQLREMEGFGQVVVGPQFESLDLVVERVAGRNDDDSRLPALPLQFFEQLQAAPVGQHDVQQNTVVIVSGDLVERRCIIGSLLDHILFPAQGLHHDLPQGGFVFDNQNLHNRTFSRCKTNARIRKETETAHVPRKPNIRKFPVPRNAGHPGICRKETETIAGFRLSVVYFSDGHPPAPQNYFSEESIWQAFEPS